MNLGRVVATVTATVKHPVYQGCKILVVALCKPDGSPTGKETLAVDTVGAGMGDLVLVLKEGNSASAILKTKKPPLQELIVGVVDHISMQGVSYVSQ